MNLLAFALMLLSPGHPAPPPSGEAIVRQAYARYAGKWPRTITYVQRVEELGTQRPQTWYTALELPGKLRVDIAPLGVGRALITSGDSTYSFGNGRLGGISRVPNPLLLLVHDLHTQAPERTIKALKELSFDLARSHEDSWVGRPMLVVGAGKGDSVSNQFWLDKERLIVVRLLYNRRQFEARIAGYQRFGGGWIEGGVEIWNKGQLVRVEQNNKIKIGMKHEAGLFDPSSYRLPKWVGDLKDEYGEVPPVPPQVKGRGRSGGG
jgi:hypothetical protein